MVIFHEILTDRVIPFQKDPQNVLDTAQVTFLHESNPDSNAFERELNRFF